MTNLTTEQGGTVVLYAQWTSGRYTVTATAGAGGSINPTSRSVATNQTTTFTVTPETGYKINTVTGCGGSLSGTTYTTGAITQDCLVTASFSLTAADDPDSAMYTLEDIYNRLDTGASGVKRGEGFVDPDTGPTENGRTLDEIMEKAPRTDNTNGAFSSSVLFGKTFWGLDDRAWGTRSGTMPNVGRQDITPGSGAQTIPRGYHDGTGTVAGDADLIPGNIKKSVSIFGVTGILGPVEAEGVPRTGQTPTSPLNPAPAGSDGALQKGVLWPDPRFTDNGNGTVTDNMTNLVWLKNADCFGVQIWSEALSAANGLSTGQCGLTDGSSSGDWRLPNIRELRSLIDFSQHSPALPRPHPFENVRHDNYWSSTSDQDDSWQPDADKEAWRVNMGNIYVYISRKTTPYYLWPVRESK